MVKIIPGGGPPPKKGPSSQGLNVPFKQTILIKNSEKKNVNNRQSPLQTLSLIHISEPTRPY